MLGPTQKWLLEQGLLRSTARFKVVMSEVPIQQEYVDPYDRWEGYAAERSDIQRHFGAIQCLVLTGRRRRSERALVEPLTAVRRSA